MFNILPAFQTPVITHTFHSKATSSLLNMLIIHEHCLPWPCPNSDPNTPPAVSLICQAPFPLQELPPPHHVKLIYHVLRYLHVLFFLWVQISSIYKDINCIGEGPTLHQYDLILTNYTYTHLISK